MRLLFAALRKIGQQHATIERQRGELVRLSYGYRQVVAENVVLRARMAVAEDLADPDARALAQSVLQTIKEL